jgi:hypothetical protein
MKRLEHVGGVMKSLQEMNSQWRHLRQDVMTQTDELVGQISKNNKDFSFEQVVNSMLMYLNEVKEKMKDPQAIASSITEESINFTECIRTGDVHLARGCIEVMRCHLTELEDLL